MKIPKVMNSYCPRCKTHSKHNVSLYKPGKRRPTSLGERRYRRKKEGYGSQRRPEQKRFAKITKKQTLRLKCTKCNHVKMRKGIRLKKLEIV